VRGLLDDVQGLLAKLVHHPPGEDGTDALDELGAEVAADGVGAGGEEGGIAGNLELEAILGIVDPAAF
jgi:hypothetical protein